MNNQGSSLERYIIAVLKACHYGGGIIIVAMMIMTTAHAIGRYGFNRPLLGIIEITKYSLITAVFLLGAYIMVVKSHVAIGIIVDRLSERVQTIIDSITYILCLAFAIVAFWQSLLRAIFIMNSGQTSSILQIPNFPFVFIIGIGWGLFSVAIIMHLIPLFTKVVKR